MGKGAALPFIPTPLLMDMLGSRTEKDYPPCGGDHIAFCYLVTPVAWWTFIPGKGREGQRKWRSANWRRRLQTENPTTASYPPFRAPTLHSGVQLCNVEDTSHWTTRCITVTQVTSWFRITGCMRAFDKKPAEVGCLFNGI